MIGKVASSFVNGSKVLGGISKNGPIGGNSFRKHEFGSRAGIASAGMLGTSSVIRKPFKAPQSLHLNKRLKKGF